MRPSAAQSIGNFMWTTGTLYCARFATYTPEVSFGPIDISTEHGLIEIAPGTHRIPAQDAMRVVAAGEVEPQPVTLDLGDLLIRHPWALHRGTPNVTDTPRALLTIRYARRWYADYGRDVNTMPSTVWESLSGPTGDHAISSFIAPRDHGIHAGGAAPAYSMQPTRPRGEQNRGSEERQRSRWLDLEEQTGH